MTHHSETGGGMKAYDQYSRARVRCHPVERPEGTLRCVSVGEPDPRELALLETWFTEATVGQLTQARVQRAYTDR